jgi:hypothetical protein
MQMGIFKGKYAISSSQKFLFKLTYLQKSTDNSKNLIEDWRQ